MLLSHKYLLKRRMLNLATLRLLFAYGKRKGKSFPNPYSDEDKKKKKKCDYCKKKGYIKSKCCKLKADQTAKLESERESEKKNKNISAKIIVVGKSLEEIIRIFIVEILAS